MTLLTILCAAAHAQTPPSLADHPNYVSYVRAVEGLDLPFAAGSRDGGTPQIMQGTIGIIQVGTVPRGFLIATKPPATEHQFLESIVYVNPTLVETINDAGFTIAYAGLLPQPGELGMDAQLNVWDNQDVANAYEAATDAMGNADGAKFLMDNLQFPDQGDIDNLDLLGITPVDTDCLDLIAYELVQGAPLEIVGWLLRERRDYGDQIEWVDHWFYRTTFAPVSSVHPSLIVRPTTTLQVPVGGWTIPEFLNQIKVKAPLNTPTGLNRRQVATYTFDDLAVLTP